MPATKNRGKSAAFISTPSNKYTNVPTTTSTTLLKIESVVPSLVKKPNKSIFRSYSTLSSSHLKTNFTTNKSADKLKSLNTFSKDTNNANNQPNGVWRINRSSKEKEKLPDRINLDRRGLTSLPIIDDEQNLRLLSLQHNLINSFCVPALFEASQPVSEQQQNGANPTELSSSIRKSDVLKTTEFNNGKITSKHLVAQKSLSSRCINMQFTGNRYPLPNSVNISNHPNIMKNSFIQKSVLLHAKEKYVFKKSNSFIHSYSQHLAASKVQLGQFMQNRLSTMSSFCSDSMPPETNSNITEANKADNVCVRNESFVNVADSLQNLVFLDLYDNQIENISTLDGLKSLTVLLLGKNRITDISGIVSVKKTLRVLDLHGNKITNIAQKICQLQELKSLNLAGNYLRLVHVDDFKGLFNLRELNLKRNKIKRIHGFDDLRSLERLWLCHNELQKVEDMSCIAKAINLKEVTIENNPVSLGGDCVSFLVSYLPNLVLLSQMQVTDQVRRAALAWRKSKETSDANYSHLSNDVSQSIRREEVISNARTNWELLRSQQQQNNKSSTFIQKTIRNASQQLQVLEIEVDMYNGQNVNANNESDLKFSRQKTVATRLENRKRTIKANRRSLSQENSSSTNVTDETVQSPSDFFRLPPILAPFLDRKLSPPSVSHGIRQKDSAGSSLGPNIDSLSSHLSSDTEDFTKNDSAILTKIEV